MKLTARFDTSAHRPTPKRPEPATPRPVESSKADDTQAPSRPARNLATAHHIQRLIDRGLIADYTAAARMLGVSQPRLTHLMALLLLAPEIQAAILLGEMAFGDKELRALARIAEWREQTNLVRNRSAGPRQLPAQRQGS